MPQLPDALATIRELRNTVQELRKILESLNPQG
jgi:hypothetical protein